MLYNCHTHTECSHDSSAKLAETAKAATAAGLIGFAVTDHCDCEFAQTEPVFESIESSVRSARAMRLPGITVHAGVELGDPLFDAAFAKRLLRELSFDVVLLSVHAVRSPVNDAPFSRIDFSGWTKDAARAYLRQYFDDLLESAYTFDYDVLAHLTIPIRYLVYKYGFAFDPASFSDQTDAVLRAVIEREKTLEVNTSGAREGYFMPGPALIRRYLELGGERLALGSDAHTPGNIANGLREAADMLRELSVKSAVYYEGRIPREYVL